jgi:hypothetical protein
VRRPYDLQIKDWVLQYDPKTALKQAHRQRFADAVASWHQASDTERKIAIPLAKKRRITTFNAWISLWNKAHPISLSGDWDAKATTWDNGASLWDIPNAQIWDAGTTTWDRGASTWDIPTTITWDNATSSWDNAQSIWST